MRIARRRVARHLLVAVGLVVAAAAAASGDGGVPIPKPNNYSWCDPGCPDSMDCLKHNGGSYCVPKCTEHAECSTGYCGKNAAGTRVCAPIHAMLLACKWNSTCVTATQVTGTACSSTTSSTVTFTNNCPTSARVYSCITTPTGPWDCKLDNMPAGLAPGQTFTHAVCDNAGYYRYFATPMATYTENFCVEPRP